MYKKALLLLFMGIIFLAASFLASRETFKTAFNGKLATATVLNVKSDINHSEKKVKNSFRLQFACGDGFELTAWSKPTSNYHEEGKELTIFCNPENPEDIAILDSTFYGFIAFWVMSFIMLIGGIILLKKAIKISAKKKRLKEIGTPIALDIHSLKATGAVMNGKKEYLINVEYKGEILRSDEGIFSKPNNGKILVYINPTDPSDYWLDTKSISSEE